MLHLVRVTVVQDYGTATFWYRTKACIHIVCATRGVRHLFFLSRLVNPSRLSAIYPESQNRASSGGYGVAASRCSVYIPYRLHQAFDSRRWMARPFCGSLSSRNPIISQNCQTFGGGHQWTLHEEDKASKLESRFGVDLHLDRKKVSKVIARIIYITR